MAAGAAIGAAAAVRASRPGDASAATWASRVDFAAVGDGGGWPGWTCPGAANLTRSGQRGLLEAATDVFPSDPRPVAFAVDQRFADGEIAALVDSGGAGVGLVLRRIAPRDYYAAVLDDEQGALILFHRTPAGATELARAAVSTPAAPFRFVLTANRTTLTSGVGDTTVSAKIDGHRSGDAGVFATARTLFPSQGPEALPALGNVHLLPYGVQEGEAFMNTAVGQELLARIRERSTAVFREITLTAREKPAATLPSVIAATSAAPLRDGAAVRVATDVPARVVIEYARNPKFRRSRRTQPRPTNDFDAVFAGLHRLKPGARVYWRARLRRNGRETIGPVRSFRTLPRAGSGQRARVAIASCASQFGPIFDELARSQPDLFIWQGDLNYPDTAGPLAQTVGGYAGIWRDFLANPRMQPILERSLFAAQRDDHDYGVQDANSTNIPAWGLTPWERLMDSRLYHRFAAGVAEIWVLDQRRFKSDPKSSDGPEKTLLGPDQRDWLLKTLAASKAPFKVVCSPCTLSPVSGNSRDGSWATGFEAERDLLLRHVAERVSGRTIFVTGDTHWTLVYEKDGLFEARPCPLGIPTPNDITITDPNVAENAAMSPGVLYADDNVAHFALLDVSGDGLDLRLVREDGATAFQRRFER